MNARRALVLVFSLAVACGGPADGPGTTTALQNTLQNTVEPGPNGVHPDNDPTRLAHSHQIADEETWQRLAARPLNQTVARTEVVKFLIDLANERRLWFTDTERWDIHYFFAHQFLNTPEHPILPPPEGHRQFNVHEYRRPDRRFECGSLVHYLDSDIWAFELIAGDNLEGARVVRAFEQVQHAVFFGDRLRYRPISELHEQQIASVSDQLPIVGSDAVFAGVRYQPLTQGVAYGTLRIVRGALDASTARPDEILVLEDLPDEIPVVAGVVSEELQAPLGHLALLCATRGTPNMGLREALSDPRITALDGQLVRMTVGGQEPRFEATTREEAERAWASRRPSRPLTPTIDAHARGLPDLCSLRVGDATSVGAKAAQLGEACAMPGIHTPGGFAVPFNYYLAHLEHSGAARGVGEMLSDGGFRSNAQIRAQRLAELRAIVERTSVDPRLIQAVREKIARFPRHPRVIFRSSTNAEDLPGFTGAGLYRSIVVSANAPDAEIADALRHVWASVWLQGAYEEREWYRIDHRQVAMGILVQPFVDGAVSNGVAITANPFYQARPGFFINAQSLGGSVTGAGGDEIPEQHLIYTYGEVPETELLTRSSRNGGARLLREEELLELAEILQRLHDHFAPYWTDPATGRDRANALDVEFLIAGPNRDVIVLQARPFNVVYQEGQAWPERE